MERKTKHTPGYDELIVLNGEAWEYFCNGCGQLRLCYNPNDEHSRCANCTSADLVRGKPGDLDKAALLAARAAPRPEGGR